MEAVEREAIQVSEPKLGVNWINRALVEMSARGIEAECVAGIHMNGNQLWINVVNVDLLYAIFGDSVAYRNLGLFDCYEAWSNNIKFYFHSSTRHVKPIE